MALFRTWNILLVLGIAGFGPERVDAEEFNVADGNVEALAEAIVSANANGEPDIIKLARDGFYQPDQLFDNDDSCEASSLPAITSRIIIAGNGATMSGAKEWRRPFCVSVSGSLVVQGLHLDDFENDGPAPGQSDQAGIVMNHGSVSLVRSTLSNAVNGGIKASFGSAIFNQEGGILELVNVTITENRAVSSITQDGSIFNAGEAIIRNSTISGNSGDPGGIVNAGEATTTLVNTLIAGNEGGDCKGEGFVSLGSNMDGDGSCGLSEPSDQLGADPGLSTFSDHGGLVPTVSLEQDGAAIDAAISGQCPPVDARGLVRAGRGNVECDIGAYERDAGAHAIEPALTASWFYQPQAGHGFNIEILGPDRNEVLAYWYTYDPEGKPLWLIGQAPIEGHRAPMAMYAFEGMRFGDFDPANNKSEAWGTLTLYFATCWRGAATWHPLDATLPAGGIPLRRLSFVDTLGCGD